MNNLIVTQGYGALEGVVVGPDTEFIDLDIQVLETDLNFSAETDDLAFNVLTSAQTVSLVTQDLTSNVITTNYVFNVEIIDYC